MICSALSLRGYKLHATDGTLGEAEDFLFTDQNWAIRYLVADTARWLGRRVLIATAALGRPDLNRRELSVNLTTQKIKASPSVEASPEITPREEALLHEHYGWPSHWGGQGVPLAGYEAGIIPPSGFSEHVATRGSIHLHGMDEVEGYSVEATDGEIGHVDDFLVDEEWRIRYLSIDTERRLPAKKALAAVDWLRGINWGERKVVVALSRDEMRDSPPYDPAQGILRDYEMRLYQHYRRPGYW